MSGHCCPGCGRTDMANITHVCPPVETFNRPAFPFDTARDARSVASLYATEDSDRGFLARAVLATAPFALVAGCPPPESSRAEC